MLQKFLFLIGSFLFSVLFHSNNVQAQQCLPQRVINQYRCVSESNTCVSWVSSSNPNPACFGTGSTTQQARDDCSNRCFVDRSECNTPYCSQYLQNGYTCSAQSFTANCTGAPDCRVIGNIYNCTWAGASCTEGIEPLNQQCYYNPPGATPPPAGGGCQSSWCTSPANCAAAGGTSGSGAGFCASGSDVRCCVPAGGGTYVAACTWDPNTPAGCTPDGVNRQYVAGGPTRPGCCNGLVEDAFGTCVCPPQTPPVVTGLTSSCDSSGLLTLSWAPAARATSYYLRINDLSTPEAPCAANATPTDICVTVNANSYSVYMPLGRSFNWWVHGVNNLGYGPAGSANASCPAPSVCTAVSNIQTVGTTCSNSQAASGTATWSWPAVTGVTAYTVSVLRVSDNAVIIPAQNIGANALNCGSGTCQYTAGPLGGSTYRLSVRPSTGTCTIPVNLSATNGPNTVIGMCPGSVQVVSKLVSTNTPNCTDIVSSTTGPSPVTYGLTPQIAPATQVTNGTNPVTWNSVPPQNYGLTITPSNDSSVAAICYSTNGGANWQAGIGGTVQSGQTLLYQVGIVPARSWARVVNGDAVICGGIRSFIPAATAQRFFSINQANFMPGVVSYGTNYDFDAATNSLGRELVSNPRWLVQENPSTICGTNWYQYIYNRYGASGLSADYTNPLNPIPKPASRQRPYIVEGNMQTSGDWTVNDGESIVFLVNGNVQINGNVRTNGKSFIAFVTSGNISISSNVGRALAENDPNLEGFYITSPSGRFITGSSTNAATAKLIVFGSVISGGFTLQRDLQSYNGNETIPAEAFRYNPMFHFSMPNEFKEMKVNWREVAP